MTETCCEPVTPMSAKSEMPLQRPAGDNAQRVAIIGGTLAAIGAASCCIVPFTLFSLGVSGAWIGNLTALEPYQSLFAAAAISFIGFGAYRLHARRKQECAPGSYCATPQSNRLAMAGLIIATSLVIGALGFPYIISRLAA